VEHQRVARTHPERAEIGKQPPARDERPVAMYHFTHPPLLAPNPIS